MRLEEMNRIADARTKGEWGFHTYDNRLEAKSFPYHGHRNVEILVSAGLISNPADKHFILMASNNWDKLIAVVEAAQEMRANFDSDYDEEMIPYEEMISCGINKLSKALEELEKE